MRIDGRGGMTCREKVCERMEGGWIRTRVEACEMVGEGGKRTRRMMGGVCRVRVVEVGDWAGGEGLVVLCFSHSFPISLTLGSPELL